MRVRPLLVLLAIVPFAIPLAAQQTASTSPATSDPQAVALLQKSLAAITGGAVITDVTLTGSAHRIAGSDDEIGTATLIAMAPSYSKMTLNLSDGPRVEIRNPAGTPLSGVTPPNAPASAQGPQLVGATSGPDGVLHPIKPNNLLTEPTWFFPAFTLARILQSQQWALSYVGSESLDNQAVVHIRATEQFPAIASNSPRIAFLLQHLSQVDIYIDPVTSLPFAVGFNAHPDTNASFDIPNQIRYSDYRTINGAQTALHAQKYVNNSLTLDLRFTAVTFNSGLTSTQFQLQ